MPIVLPAASALPEVTLRVDDSGTPFGDSPTWSDYSDALATGGDGQPISITRLRQDGQSEPQPAVCTFVLENTSGAYTPGNPAAAAGWDVGARINVRLTIGATVYDRFDGYVDSIEPAYPGQDWSVVAVQATDITARLAIGQPLASLVVQEMLTDSPTYLYPLSEDSGSTSAGDITGQGDPAATRRDSKYGPGTFQFGADTGLADTIAGLTLGAEVSGSNVTGPATALNLPPAMLPTTGAFTLLMWVLADTNPTISYELVDAVSANQLALDLVIDAAGELYASAQNFAAFIGGGTVITDGLPHLLAIRMSANRLTLDLLIDGVLAGTQTVGAAMTFSSIVDFVIGAQLNTIGASDSQYAGVVSLVTMFTSAVSTPRLLTYYQAGVGTLVESSDERYGRLAGYAGVTTGTLPTGVATVGHQDTMGKTITDALQQVARSEGSVSYATGAGALMFQSREARYNATTGLTLTSADINPDATTRRDRQGMANEFTVTRPGGASQRVVDTTAQAADGRFDGGSLDVVVSTDADARHIAEWEVGTRKTPKTRLPNLTVDLLTLADAALVEGVLAADLSTLITVTDLPDQAPDSSMSVFLEGWTETIGVLQWTWQAFTSPNLPPVWQLEHPVFGQIDSTNVLAL